MWKLYCRNSSEMEGHSPERGYLGSQHIDLRKSQSDEAEVSATSLPRVTAYSNKWSALYTERCTGPLEYSYWWSYQ